MLVDQAKQQIQVSLWGKNATNDEYTEGSVLAIKGARQSDYGGISLNAGDNHSMIYPGPDHHYKKQLEEWLAL